MTMFGASNSPVSQFHIDVLTYYLRLYFLIGIVSLAITGWTHVLHPSLSETLNNLLVFGKLRSVKRSKWQQRIEVPKRWFVHFYALAFVYGCFTVAALYGYAKPYDFWHASWSSPRLRLCALLFTLHALRRLYECLFVSVFSDSNMNLLHYVLGLTFYVAVLLAMPFGYIPNKGADTLHHYQVVLGVIIYLWSIYHQHVSFRILAQLRDGRSNRTHSIPEGDLFRFVSTPHYLCECCLYAAFWLILGFGHTIWPYIIVFVWNNQILCAIMTHRWYVKTFNTKYPVQRCVFIPLIW